MDENIDDHQCVHYDQAYMITKTSVMISVQYDDSSSSTFSPSFMKKNKKVWALQILNKSSYVQTDWPAHTCGMFERERERNLG